MNDELAQLEPRSVWGQFANIARIPRPSKHEHQVSAYVRAEATRLGLVVHADRVGNLVVDVPATPGREHAPVVILQGHLDMVGEKNKEVDHDFLKDPIRPRLGGEWVTATGTTLGADNGIGVAAALAVAADREVEHGPLQLLFTIDEETGLTGAKELDASLLRGKTLLNLDSEEDAVLFVGCAGGKDSHLSLAPRREVPPGGLSPFLLEVGGLRGGHSGLNIVENRGNALKLAARILDAARTQGIPFRLTSVLGGSKHNAIPREAEARLYADPATRSALEGVVACMSEAFRGELEGIDEGLQTRVGPCSGAPGARVLSTEDRDRLLDLLLALPHGVLAMSPAIPGLVETSNNLAVVREEGERILIVTSSRSSVMPTLDAVAGSVGAAGRLAGANVEIHDGYPGWKPNVGSPVLAVVREVYRRQWGQEPKVTAIHAGLECGLLGQKVPGLDMISFGPQIEGAHSPDERVHVPSVQRFWKALCAVLVALSGN